MTDEHKKKISESSKGKTRNNGKIWVTDGKNPTRIFPEQLQEYILRGFVRGKKVEGKQQIPWNKGLTKEDLRVQKYIDNRK